MSFSLDVLLPSIPTKSTEWLDELRSVGLAAEPIPGFSFGGWRGGYLPCEVVETPSAFPAAPRGSTGSVPAGFELDISGMDGEQLVRLVAAADPNVAHLLKDAKYVATFSTPASRSVVDVRLQCFAAAALSIVANGILYDPQEGLCYSGAAAYAAAARQVSAYERTASQVNDE
jgi:hypothetical protein